MKFKKIFITGGAGYVGSALVPSLLEKGYFVTVYDLFMYGEDVLKPHPNLRQIKGDIRDRNDLIESSKDHEAFIHLACISNDPSFDLDPGLGKSINFDAFQNIIDSCKQNQVKRLIVASSTSQYGIKPLDIDVTEDTLAEPITDYSKYKIMCEELLMNSDVGDLEFVFSRPATLCGYAPRLRLDLSVNVLTIHALVNKKIKIFGGAQMRPALHIKDMVRFYETLLEAPKEKIHRQAFNIALKNITIKEIAEMVKKTLGDESIEFEVTPSDDNRSYHINTDKIKRILDFECKYSFEDAVRGLQNAYEQGLIVDGLNNPFYYNIKRMKEIGLEKNNDDSDNFIKKPDHLESKAKDYRKKIIDFAVKTGHSHLGGSLSTVEILISLYDGIIKDNDKFILSKGHGNLSYYLSLQEKGFSPKCSGHPDMDEKNGIHCTTGSLGHGLPIGLGMAFARKFLNQEGHIYVLLGDGECQEGTIWESLLLAKRFKLNNLTVIVDHNNLQALGTVDTFLEDNGLKKKFDAFGFKTTKVDGHNFEELFTALDEKNIEQDRPRAIIAHTIKGKGISFMENDPKWHTRLPNEEEIKKAYDELK